MNRRAFVASLVAGSTTLLAGEPKGGEPMEQEAAAPEEILDPAAVRELGEHRIARIEARRLQDRYPRFVGRNSRGRPAGRGGGYQIRIITTDKGAQGWGMSHGPAGQAQPFIGRRLVELYDPQRGPAEDACRLQIPLHDLVGTILGKPVYALLGGHGSRHVPIYSGAIYFDDLEPEGKPRGVPGVLASCQQDYEAGYRAFKLKIGRGAKWMTKDRGIRRDIEVTRAVHERFPDCEVLVDANNGYAVDDFCTYLSALGDCPLAYIEEPFHEEREPLARLRDHLVKLGSRALIVEGEMRTERATAPWRFGGYSRRHVDNLFALAREKLVHVLNLDLGIVGFTRWRHVMGELEAEGLSASPHTWAWTPRPYYAAQLAGGVGNVCIIEGIPGAARGVDYSAYRFIKGKLFLPEAPGFGLKLET